ncbi:MAG: hydantoinase/oxoprolinase family protein [Rhodospirillaceae bacterium]|jgi:N-methylhydantoinase A|nr:hydantoinase/oxoprolinase family protein [Rhodospirillaceae bacterium]
MRYLMAADTGGTFTDLAVHDTENRTILFGKTLTNYTDLVNGVLDAIQETDVALKDAAVVKHGTTHVINTFLQRSGARTALVTTQGFRDALEIGRASRPVPFQLTFRRDPPLVERALRFEVNERIGARGEVLRPLDLEEVDRLAAELAKQRVDAIAVSLLNSYINPAHENAVAARLRSLLPDVFITTGTSISGEWYEYERTSTAAANAYIGAQMRTYTLGFENRMQEQGFTGAFYMMGSNGGLLTVERTLEQPVAMVESGPVGGCIGASAYAKALGLDRVIAFDMGGTTAKCALIEEGRFEVQPAYYVGGYERGFPVRTAVLDIVEVGAGGGTIAWIDEHDRLRLGPRSAGSEPGPVSFGRGGVEPTVTDASVSLGRIGSGSFMDGKLAINTEAANEAIRDHVAAPLGYVGADGVDQVAHGIIELVTTIMSGAIKEITIERGHDVREFHLFVFGGGGPLFGSELARSLSIPNIIVPPQPGNFSSIGMLLAEPRVDMTQTYLSAVSEAGVVGMGGILSELEIRAEAAMAQEIGVESIRFDHQAEMRYQGQMHSVRIDLSGHDTVDSVTAGFEAMYRRRYGHLNADCPIEMIGLRVSATVATEKPDLAQISPASAECKQGDEPPAPISRRQVYFKESGARIETPVYARTDLPLGFSSVGPVIIEEYSATTVVAPGDEFWIGKLGEIWIRCDLEGRH